jgi:hypothetical protein
MSSWTPWEPEPRDGPAWDGEFVALSYDYGTTYADSWYCEELPLLQFLASDVAGMDPSAYTFEYPPIISEASEILPISRGGRMGYGDAPKYLLPLSCPTCDTYFSGTYSSGGNVRHSKRACIEIQRHTIGPCSVMDNHSSSCHNWYCYHGDCNNCSHHDCDLGSAKNNSRCYGCHMFHMASYYELRSVLNNNLFPDSDDHECDAS